MIKIEASLSPKRKKFLLTLRENSWELIDVDKTERDWVFDSKWTIESRRENYGKKIYLYFFLNSYKNEEIDQVVAALPEAVQPGAYCTESAMNFKKGKFEKELKLFY